MALYTWRNLGNGAGGAFDVAADWSNPTETVSSTVPSAGDTAAFTMGGGPISGSGSVDTIAFSAAAWSITGQLTATTVTLDAGSLTAATNGGQLVVNGAIQVGLQAGAAVIVANNGSISVTSNAAGPVSQFGSASLTVSNRGIAAFGNLNLGVNNASTTAVVNMAVLAVGGVLQLGGGANTAGAGSLAIGNGGTVVLSAATDNTQSYLKVGAVTGASGSLTVDGVNSILLLSNNSGAIGYRGTGSLSVTNGASARFNASANASNNALNPALTIGLYGTGTVTVSGTGSLVAAGGSIIVGTNGQGSLQVQNGASVTSVAFVSPQVASQAALAVGTAGGGTGTVVIDGAGTSLMASGAAILGGDNRGSGLTSGGTGVVRVTNGGSLTATDVIILAGSTLSVDGTSQAGFSGSLILGGALTSAGTLVVNGAVYGGGQLSLGGGLANIGTLGAFNLPAASLAFTSGNATIRLGSVVGANSIAAMQQGDAIDLANNTSVRLVANVITTTSGTITLSAAPTGSHYALESDGANGTEVVLNVDTIGVYRFFDSNYGTHFFSASDAEKATILATRPDLVYEGIGLQAINPTANDPNASQVYRFFDSNYGTHFFTASLAERDTVMGSRPDLDYEGNGFFEHITQQTGDTPVFRFFDTRYGTHFYTADANERATIVATRPDLVDEGAGFYAPTN